MMYDANRNKKQNILEKLNARVVENEETEQTVFMENKIKINYKRKAQNLKKNFN